MARSTKRIVWYEMGFWTYDEDGADWNVVAAYESGALLDEDFPKAQAIWKDAVLVKRTKAVEVITG